MHALDDRHGENEKKNKRGERKRKKKKESHREERKRKMRLLTAEISIDWSRQRDPSYIRVQGCLNRSKKKEKKKDEGHTVKPSNTSTVKGISSRVSRESVERFSFLAFVLRRKRRGRLSLGV